MEPWQREMLTVEATKEPITQSRLVTDLSAIGLKARDIVIVHSSMSKIGWTVGDSTTVIDALMEVLTSDGTLVIPTHSTANGEPNGWKYPPIPEEWWQTIRDETPPYRPDITPTRGIGRIPEVFRKYPDVHRSNHPQVSFAAWGKHAQEIVKTHAVDQAYGRESPLGKAYELNARILLIGTSHEFNTSLHHAETRTNIPGFPRMEWAAAILEDGIRVWKTWEELNYQSDDFEKVGDAFETQIGYKPRNIGQATSRLLVMRELIDFAVEWMESNRKYTEN